VFELVETTVDEVALLFGFEGRAVRERERERGEEGVVVQVMTGKRGESGEERWSSREVEVEHYRRSRG